MAKSATERQREKRARDKLRQQEREARLLSRRISLDLYHATDAALAQIMATTGLEEPQDAITRIIHNTARLDADQLRAFLRQP